MSNNLETKIKMFRMKELGDCFLLTFKIGKDESNMIIDCGSFKNGNESVTHIRKVVNKISEELKDKSLDLVVATHQHNDHMSGFLHAKKQFIEMAPEQVFLSWLDDPRDVLASEISDQNKKILQEIKKVSSLLKKKGEAGKNLAFRINDQVDTLNARGKDSVTQKATDFLKEIGQKKVKYVNPGEIIEMPGLPSNSVRLHILGPPRNYKSIRDTSPNKGESYDKHMSEIIFGMDDFVSSLEPSGKNESDYPFNDRFKKLKSNPQLKFINGIYKNEPWRMIDTDWMETGEEMALHLNSYTNNTSIAMAIELVESGKFLLFVGDAQIGNWKSWDGIDWKDDDSRTMDEIYRNVVFYKVGHHGSHNATFKPGLDRMNHKELVAFIPVDRRDDHIDPKKRKKPWKMPAKNLYRELKKKTEGRIARMDDGKIRYKEDNWEENSLRKTKYFIEYIIR